MNLSRDELSRVWSLLSKKSDDDEESGFCWLTLTSVLDPTYNETTGMICTDESCEACSLASILFL